MKKLLLIALGSVVPLVGFTDTVSYERRNCYTSTRYDSNYERVYLNVDCNRVKNHIKSYNQTYANSDPIRQKSIVGDIQGLRDSAGMGTIAYEVEVRTRPNTQQTNNTAPDSPYIIPDVQQAPRPETNYYDPSIGAPDSETATNVTYDLGGEISESANSRVSNNLEVSKFQNRRSACSGTGDQDVNLCYRTSTEGAVKSTDPTQ